MIQTPVSKNTGESMRLSGRGAKQGESWELEKKTSRRERVASPCQRDELKILPARGNCDTTSAKLCTGVMLSGSPLALAVSRRARPPPRAAAAAAAGRRRQLEELFPHLFNRHVELPRN